MALIVLLPLLCYTNFHGPIEYSLKFNSFYLLEFNWHSTILLRKVEEFLLCNAITHGSTDMWYIRECF